LLATTLSGATDAIGGISVICPARGGGGSSGGNGGGGGGGGGGGSGEGRGMPNRNARLTKGGESDVRW